MVGGLALHQVQPFTIQPNSAIQVSDQRPRDQSPCPPPLHQVKSMEEFRQSHAQFIKLGLNRIPRHASELLLACALSDWGSLDYAQAIFSGFDEPCTFDYNTMIRAHIDGDQLNAALVLYQDMMEAEAMPDNYTFPFVLKACARVSSMRAGIQVHGHALKFGFGDDVFVQNSLINLYGKCDDVDAACRVFDQMGSDRRTVASWSTIVAVHSRTGLWSDCLRLFAVMIGSGLRPDESSLVSVLASCARLGVLDVGRSIHASLIRNFTGLNVIVQTSLVDMYVNCGQLEKGLKIFDQMPEKNRWTYSVLISGMVMHGVGEQALKVFAEMLREEREPDEAVYVGVLNACSRAGLVEEGLQFFDRMRLEHRIVPTAQHYGCLVDLMGRAGKLSQAHALICSMPVDLPRDSAWRSLLSACKVHSKLELAEHAVRNLAELNCVKAGDYVILSNMYASVGRWDDAARARTEMVDRGLVQVPGFSRIEVQGKMHTFVSMDKSHPRSEEIYEMLHQMQWQLRFEGYTPDVSQVVLHNTKEEDKLEVVNGHSQKLAIAFGLLNTSEGDSMRIITNLRMCRECHTYTGLISKIFEREIVVRDRNRFHCFRGGVCSCRDHW